MSSAAATDAAKAADLAAALAAANELTDPTAAASALRTVALATPGADGPECVKIREAAVGALCANRATARDGPGLAGLLTDLRPLFTVIPKAKTAKLVRGVIDAIAKVPGSEALQVKQKKRRERMEQREARAFGLGGERGCPSAHEGVAYLRACLWRGLGAEAGLWQGPGGAHAEGETAAPMVSERAFEKESAPARPRARGQAPTTFANTLEADPGPGVALWLGSRAIRGVPGPRQTRSFAPCAARTDPSTCSPFHSP